MPPRRKGASARATRSLFKGKQSSAAAKSAAGKPKKAPKAAGAKKKGSTPMRKTLEALSPSPSKSKGMWASMCEHLTKYKETHGTCNVPYKYDAVPKLGRWVHHQRYMYRKYKKDASSSTLSEERVEELRALGALESWEGIKTESRKWDDSLGRLRSYGVGHDGDYNVPTNYAEDQQLGRWVMTQKQQLKKYRANAESSQLSAERVQKLEGLGAADSWTSASAKRRKGSPRTWEQSCELLQGFMDKHDGSSCVPTKFVEDLQLGNWVVTQKQQLKKYMSDPATSQLTDGRYQKLQSMGVIEAWTSTVSKEAPAPRCSFNEIVEKLVEYAKNNDGDFNVPYSKTEPDQQLSRWVDNQRRLYRKHKEDPEKFDYPPKRLKQLSDLGVLASWDTAQLRTKVPTKGLQHV